VSEWSWHRSTGVRRSPTGMEQVIECSTVQSVEIALTPSLRVSDSR
jgi:hypothetical protein